MKRNFIKRVAASGSAICLAMSLAACSGGGDVKTAKELAEKAAEVGQDNFACVADISMGMSIKSSGFSFDMPISAKFDIQTNGKAASGTATVSLEMGGETSSETMQVYADDTGSYQKGSDGDIWTVTNTGGLDLDSLKDMTSASVFENAALEYDNDTDCYIVTTTVGDLMSNEAISDLILDSGALTGLEDDPDATEGGKEMLDQIKNSDAALVYTYDSGYHVKSIHMEETPFTMTEKVGDAETTTTVNLGLDFQFSKHGEIGDIARPDGIDDAISIDEAESDYSFDDEPSDDSYDEPSDERVTVYDSFEDMQTADIPDLPVVEDGLVDTTVDDVDPENVFESDVVSEPDFEPDGVLTPDIVSEPAVVDEAE